MSVRLRKLVLLLVLVLQPFQWLQAAGMDHCGDGGPDRSAHDPTVVHGGPDFHAPAPDTDRTADGTPICQDCSHCGACFATLPGGPQSGYPAATATVFFSTVARAPAPPPTALLRPPRA